jgi:hypothetical protein
LKGFPDRLKAVNEEFSLHTGHKIKILGVQESGAVTKLNYSLYLTLRI